MSVNCSTSAGTADPLACLPAAALVSILSALDSVDIRALGRTSTRLWSVLFFFQNYQSTEAPTDPAGTSFIDLWGKLILARFPDYTRATGVDSISSLARLLGGFEVTANSDPSLLEDSEGIAKMYPDMALCADPQVPMPHATLRFDLSCPLDMCEEPDSDPTKAAADAPGRAKRDANLPNRRMAHRFYMLYRLLERARLSPAEALEGGLRSFVRAPKYIARNQLGYGSIAPAGYGVCGPLSLFALVSDWCGVLNTENELRQRLAGWAVGAMEDAPQWLRSVHQEVVDGKDTVGALKRARGEAAASGPASEQQNTGANFGSWLGRKAGFEFNWESTLESDEVDEPAEEDDEPDAEGAGKGETGGPDGGPTDPAALFAAYAEASELKRKREEVSSALCVPRGAEHDALEFLLRNFIYTQCRLETTSEWNAENYKWDLVLGCNIEVVLVGLEGRAVLLSFVGRSDHCYWSFGGDGGIRARVVPLSVALHHASSALGVSAGTVGIRTERCHMPEFLGYSKQERSFGHGRRPGPSENHIDTSRKKNQLTDPIDFVVEPGDVVTLRDALGLPAALRPEVFWKACATMIVPDSGWLWEQKQTLFTPHSDLAGHASLRPTHVGMRHWS